MTEVKKLREEKTDLNPGARKAIEKLMGKMDAGKDGYNAGVMLIKQSNILPI